MTPASKYTAMAEALRDFNTYQELNQLQINMWEELTNAGLRVNPYNSWKPFNAVDHIGVYFHTYNLGHNYDWIMQQKNIELSHSNQVKAVFKHSHVLANGIELSAKIPEENMMMLELLGKVDIEVTKAQPITITKKVFCPTGMSASF